VGVGGGGSAFNRMLFNLQADGDITEGFRSGRGLYVAVDGI